jgi:hypothetical protein
VFVELEMRPLLSSALYGEFSVEMEKHRTKLLEKEELEAKRLEELQAKRVLKKDRLRNSEEFWLEKPTTELVDLKNCNHDEHFP